MPLGENVVNKIITVNEIVEIANYLERAREQYQKLIDDDNEKNKDLSYSEQQFEFRSSHAPYVEYRITFSDNRTITQQEYVWFSQNIELPEKITRIEMNFNVHFRDKIEGFKHNSFTVTFTQDKASVHAYSNKLEAETNRMIDDVMNILNATPVRYDSTIKNRTIRIQSFCLSVGLILSYIMFYILKFMVALPEKLQGLLNDKNVLIFGQWVVAAVVGNVFCNFIISSWYKNLLPKTKYAGYDRKNHKSIYIDNVDDYIGHCEVHIGNFANNQKDRKRIEKVYSVAKIIVVVQLLISVYLYYTLK